jgi:L-ascorbate metabolism protein UlaG (beta-lactamase superfamily)
MRFRNPPGSPPQTAGLREFAPFFLRRALDRPPPLPAGYVVPEHEAREALARGGSESLTWLGHASFLIRTAGRTVLTDPFLSERAGPVAGLGPKRFVPPGIPVDLLPKIDVLLISHNHYDHLDARTVESLSSKERITVVVPSGLRSFFLRRGYTDVRELAWGAHAALGDLSVTALPAIHFSSRTLFDRNATLWASYSIVSPSLRVFFAGDTGYGPVHRETGLDHGPFDLALLPIGAYEPEPIMRPVHCNPEEAVRLGADVRGKTLVAMHWGTVRLTDEPPFEPPGRFLAAGRAAGFDERDLWVMKIGETRIPSAAPRRGGTK